MSTKQRATVPSNATQDKKHHMKYELMWTSVM